MKLLEEKDYHKLTEPLKEVTINNLFARSVIEHCVKGKVYVDNYDNPKTFYIVHLYMMSLLFGHCHNREFNESFRQHALNLHKTRNDFEWMQAFPDNWDAVLKELFNDCLVKSSENTQQRETGIIELNTRINFKFNQAKYLEFKRNNIVKDFRIVQTDKQIFKEMKGSVVPFYFWNNAEDFCKNGIGYSLFFENKLASTAYSGFIHDNKLEIGIETIEAFRGRGLAQHTCAALIDYCIENHLEPVWACKLENGNSYKLAQKIGFEPCAEIPYYRLSK